MEWVSEWVSYVGPCHHGMARPRFVNGRDDLQVWRVVENMLNKNCSMKLVTFIGLCSRLIHLPSLVLTLSLKLLQINLVLLLKFCRCFSSPPPLQYNYKSFQQFTVILQYCVLLSYFGTLGVGVAQWYSAGLRAGWSGCSSPDRSWEFFSSPPRPDRIYLLAEWLSAFEEELWTVKLVGWLVGWLVSEWVSEWVS
jgi:hypothetical protein